MVTHRTRTWCRDRTRNWAGRWTGGWADGWAGGWADRRPDRWAGNGESVIVHAVDASVRDQGTLNYDTTDKCSDLREPIVVFYRGVLVTVLVVDGDGGDSDGLEKEMYMVMVVVVLVMVVVLEVVKVKRVMVRSPGLLAVYSYYEKENLIEKLC